MSFVRRVDHVGIAVPDMAAAVARYKSWGFAVVHEETNEAQGVREVMLAAPTGETQLQLLAPLNEQSPIAKFLDKRGPGVQQLAFTVDDVREAASALRAQGATMLYEEPARGTAGSLVNFVHPRDTGGVLIELVQPHSA
ncbi:MAG: methylmalonyl-CoA epimerase [Corynebacteriales bacterium]|nr:methylmalonyl-CoA epimerase [Mycobacteriales bacterium]